MQTYCHVVEEVQQVLIFTLNRTRLNIKLRKHCHCEYNFEEVVISIL